VLWVWLPVALYAALIFVASSIPADGMPGGPWWRFDKVIHAAVYAILGLLLVRAFRLGPPRLAPWPAALAAAALAILYGVSDELHQSFTPGRDASMMDAVADAVGAIGGAGLGSLVYRTRSVTHERDGSRS
jgi:VanZ family protein